MYHKRSPTCSNDPNIIEYCPTDQQYPDCIKICPKNKWISKPNGKDYYFPTQYASYDDAVAYCSSKNSKLISVNNSYDRYIVNHMIEDCGEFEWSFIPSPPNTPFYASIYTHTQYQTHIIGGRGDFLMNCRFYIIFHQPFTQLMLSF